MIISCFAGSGKSYMTTLGRNESFIKDDLKLLDLESSNYQWKFEDNLLPVEERKGINEKVKNPNFIDNYINSIIKYEILGNNILISSQSELLKVIAKMDFPLILVFPSLDCKEEYIQRYRDRGNNENFIKLMEDNFENFVNSMKNNKDATLRVELSKGKYVRDFITSLWKEVYYISKSEKADSIGIIDVLTNKRSNNLIKI